MNTRLSTLTVIVLCSFSLMMCAMSNTAGSVEFTITTKPTTQRYAPQHVLAVWVTDTSGNFIKTLKIQGSREKYSLSTWMENSELNEVDAVATATLKTHQTHTITWDCRDTTGTVVNDGDYQIHVEFTEYNGQGPVTPADHIQFSKADESVSLTFDDLEYFYDIKLQYIPEAG